MLKNSLDNWLLQKLSLCEQSIVKCFALEYSVKKREYYDVLGIYIDGVGKK